MKPEVAGVHDGPGACVQDVGSGALERVTYRQSLYIEPADSELTLDDVVRSRSLGLLAVQLRLVAFLV